MIKVLPKVDRLEDVIQEAQQRSKAEGRVYAVSYDYRYDEWLAHPLNVTYRYHEHAHLTEVDEHGLIEHDSIEAYDQYEYDRCFEV